jgi:transcriptional regulator with XRE-family HTH domain
MKTKTWPEVRGRRSAETEARFRTVTADMRTAMRLADIRKARQLTQATLASTMEVAQGEISKIERREDLYLSTLRRFLEGMGAELVLVARFADQDIPVQLDEPAVDRR